MQKCLLVLLLVANIGFAQPVSVSLGTPEYFWLTTFSIGDYEGDGSDLPYGGNVGDRFAEQMTGAVERNSNLSVYRTRHVNNECTVAECVSDDVGFHEMAFYFGHGTWGDYMAYDDRIRIASNYYYGPFTPEKIYPIWGNYTKWVIMNSCLTLGCNPTFLASKQQAYYVGNVGRFNYEQIFQGVHAIAGFSSLSFNFSVTSINTDKSHFGIFGWEWWSTDYADHSDVYHWFSSYWCDYGYTFSYAWYFAHWNTYVDRYSSGQFPGVECTTIGVLGTINNNGQQQMFSGAREKFKESLRLPTPMGYYQTAESRSYWSPWPSLRNGENSYGIERLTYVIGTPKYESW